MIRFPSRRSLTAFLEFSTPLPRGASRSSASAHANTNGQIAGRLARLLVPLLSATVVACALMGVTPPEVTVADLKPLPGTALEQRLAVVVRLVNSNDFPLTIDGASLQLSVNGEMLSTGVTAERVTLPRLGTGTIEVPFTVSTLGVFGGLLSILSKPGDKAAVRYALDGFVFVERDGSRIRLPVAREGALALEPSR